MTTTTEMRWFYQGLPSQAVQTWFTEDCPGDNLQPTETREDTYLFLPECEFLNLKYRQGRFELKWCQQKIGVLSLFSHAEGLAQVWVKASFDNCDEAMLPSDTQSHHQWIKVKKQRSQRQYSRQDNGSFKAVNPDCDISQGGTVELTRLTRLDQNWWTLAFEIFGPQEQQQQILYDLARDILPTYPGLPLKAQDSYAYPMWLNNVNKNL